MARRPVLVTGAGGRLGRLLRALWPTQGADAIFLTRAEWDILAGPVPDLPKAAVLLDLSGAVRGDFSLNPRLARRTADVTRQLGGRLLYVSTASVYPGGPEDMAEDRSPAPASDYGRSKVAAEAEVFATDPTARVLRLGNIAGADALLSQRNLVPSVVLDPVSAGPRGPIRSYIGPHMLARVLAEICTLAASDSDLPAILNVAQPGEVAMADLLGAAGMDWVFGPFRAGVIERAVLSTLVLERLVPVAPATAASVVADLDRLGKWP